MRARACVSGEVVDTHAAARRRRCDTYRTTSLPPLSIGADPGFLPHIRGRTHVRIMHPILIKRKGSGEQLSETEFECSYECARGIQASETHGRARRRRNQLGIEAVGAAVPRCAAAAHGAPRESRAAAPARRLSRIERRPGRPRARRWARLNWGPRCLRGTGHLDCTPCTGDGRATNSVPSWALGRARPRSVWKKATATTAAQKRRGEGARRGIETT